ncbi:MAG: glycosyltransferase [Candidatus Omnitrophica bacterium]|nr:glycosyltransferase [Candidatus Omnitrophota bacterium]
MKILHAIASIDPSYGGPAFALRGLLGELDKQGVRQTILTCSQGRKKDVCNEKHFTGADIIWSTPLVSRYFWSPFLPSKLKKLLKRYDVVHVHGLFNGLVYDVCRNSAGMSVPYIIRPFGTMSAYCMKKSRLKKRCSLFFGEKSNIEKAGAIHFTTIAEKIRAQDNFKFGYSFVIPNGIDHEFLYKKTGNRNPERKNETVFLFLGRVSPIKGLDVFIPAFMKWAKNQKGSRPVLIIAGPEEEHYKTALNNYLNKDKEQPSVVFKGPVYGEKKKEVLQQADAVVLPSYHENFGMSIIEGMSCGKPVLVSDKVDLSGEIEKHSAGRVFSLEEVSICRELDSFVAQKNEWKDMGESGMEWVRKHCDWGIIGRKILSEYEKVIKKATE